MPKGKKRANNKPQGAVSADPSPHASKEFQQKVASLREILPNLSHDQAEKLLTHCDGDVNQSVEAYSDGSVNELLNEWNVAGNASSAKEKKKKRKETLSTPPANDDTQQAVASAPATEAVGQANEPPTTDAERHDQAAKQAKREAKRQQRNKVIKLEAGEEFQLPKPDPSPFKTVSSKELRKREMESLKRMGHDVSESGMRRIDIPLMGGPSNGMAGPPGLQAAPIGSVGSASAPSTEARRPPTVDELMNSLGMQARQALSNIKHPAAESLKAANQALMNAEVALERQWAAARSQATQAFASLKQVIADREAQILRALEESKFHEARLLAERKNRLSQHEQTLVREIDSPNGVPVRLSMEIEQFNSLMQQDAPNWQVQRFGADVSGAIRQLAQFGAIVDLSQPQAIQHNRQQQSVAAPRAPAAQVQQQQQQQPQQARPATQQANAPADHPAQAQPATKAQGQAAQPSLQAQQQQPADAADVTDTGAPAAFNFVLPSHLIAGPKPAQPKKKQGKSTQRKSSDTAAAGNKGGENKPANPAQKGNSGKAGPKPKQGDGKAKQGDAPKSNKHDSKTKDKAAADKVPTSLRQANGDAQPNGDAKPQRQQRQRRRQSKKSESKDDSSSGQPATANGTAETSSAANGTAETSSAANGTAETSSA